MRLLKNFKKLKASSIVESVMAIALISICVLVASLVYLNVVRQNESVHFLEAKHKVEFLAQESIMQQDYEDDFFEFKHYTITKTVKLDKAHHIAFLSFLINVGNKQHHINKLIPYYET